MCNLRQRNGVLAPFIWDFLRMRRNLGFKSRHTEYSLFAFDDFANRKGLTNVTITKELAWPMNGAKDVLMRRPTHGATEIASSGSCPYTSSILVIRHTFL